MTQLPGEKLGIVFAELKKRMAPLEPDLIVKTDEPGNYYLDTPSKRGDGYVYAFGGVQLKKNYVSYHLMPVYAQPELLDGVSDGLKKRMQGKSCFNFKQVDERLFSELETLTLASFEAFKEKSMIS